jgi:hypothetical protein
MELKKQQMTTIQKNLKEKGGKMTQICPLCGKPVYPARNFDPDSLTGKFYFCAATPESCRATFPRVENAQVSYAWDQPVKWLL